MKLGWAELLMGGIVCLIRKIDKPQHIGEFIIFLFQSSKRFLRLIQLGLVLK